MILMLGTPGAGKTTQTQLLAEYLGCRWYSMGELIRSSVTGQVREDMLAGKIIGDDVTIGIVDKALSQFDPAKEECIFEGNPRSIPQAKWWMEQERSGRFEIKGIIHLEADLSIAEQRMVKRGRLDDHDDNVIDRRFDEYKRSVIPTLEYLRQNGVPVFDISANGSIDDISNQIHKALGV